MDSKMCLAFYKDATQHVVCGSETVTLNLWTHVGAFWTIKSSKVRIKRRRFWQLSVLHDCFHVLAYSCPHCQWGNSPNVQQHVGWVLFRVKI